MFLAREHKIIQKMNLSEKKRDFKYCAMTFCYKTVILRKNWSVSRRELLSLLYKELFILAHTTFLAREEYKVSTESEFPRKTNLNNLNIASYLKLLLTARNKVYFEEEEESLLIKLEELPNIYFDTRQKLETYIWDSQYIED